MDPCSVVRSRSRLAPALLVVVSTTRHTECSTSCCPRSSHKHECNPCGRVSRSYRSGTGHYGLANSGNTSSRSNGCCNSTNHRTRSITPETASPWEVVSVDSVDCSRSRRSLLHPLRPPILSLKNRGRCRRALDECKGVSSNRHSLAPRPSDSRRYRMGRLARLEVVDRLLNSDSATDQSNDTNNRWSSRHSGHPHRHRKKGGGESGL